MSAGNGKWESVSRNHPCQKCGKPDWCKRSEGGSVIICRRIEGADGVHKVDASGADYWVYGLDGRNVSRVELPTAAKPERAAPPELHRVYHALLHDLLALSKTHREALRARGLTDAQIDTAEYRTLPPMGRSDLAKELVERFGADLCAKVPGLYVKTDDDRGRKYWSLGGAAGIVIPIRNAKAQIVALVTRLDDPGDYGKYTSISSTKHEGPGPGAPVHVPLFSGPRFEARATEGVLKADLATILSGTLTLGISGVSGWRAVVPVLHELKVQRVLLGFDADACTNHHVARALKQSYYALKKERFEVCLETWDPDLGKGIDDLLAAGHTPKLHTNGEQIADFLEKLVYEARMTSDAPFRAKEEARLAAEATVTRVLELVKDDPGAAFEPEALHALFLTHQGEPARWVRVKTALQRAKVPMRDLMRALSALEPEVTPGAQPRNGAVERDLYIVQGGVICHEADTDNGPVTTPLCNFNARIVDETIRDDGAERLTFFGIEGQTQDGAVLPRIEVPAGQYGQMHWITDKWGARAIVNAGYSTRDYLRAGLQVLSGPPPQRVEYAHTGWRLVDGAHVYLHTGGAVGAAGPVPGIEVELSGSRLPDYLLPDPPTGDGLKEAIRAVLGLLLLAAPDITYPLIATTYRAPLAEAMAVDFSLYLVGGTGCQKSELTALAQQHFGAAFHAKHLPGNWTSTENSLEKEVFLIKDAVFTIDDFAPTGTATDVQRLHQKADRILRGQGNHAGRGRMKADGGLRVQYYPRGILVSSGEDQPNGHSLRARLVTLELKRGDVDLALLTTAQKQAAAGLLAQCMSGYIQWLAPQLADLSQQLRDRHAELRADFRAQGTSHDRTPDNSASLALGMETFLRFAQTKGVLTSAEVRSHWQTCWSVLTAGAVEQANHQSGEDVVTRFLVLLNAALMSGQAHVADAEQSRHPANPNRWGWREREMGFDANYRREWLPQGPRIGWVDSDDLLLEPEAAYATVQRFAQEQKTTIPTSPRTLWKRMDERGLLILREKPRFTCRRQIAGTRLHVLALRTSALSNGLDWLEPQASGTQPALPLGAPEDPIPGAARHENGHSGTPGTLGTLHDIGLPKGEDYISSSTPSADPLSPPPSPREDALPLYELALSRGFPKLELGGETVKGTPEFWWKFSADERVHPSYHQAAFDALQRLGPVASEGGA